MIETINYNIVDPVI